MHAKDLYHHAVVQSLKADGWTITHDPLYIAYGGRNLFVDLGAEREAIAAEKDGQKIAVEIKSFLNPSPIHDLQDAVGQYDIYRSVLLEVEPDRLLYLAISQRVYEGIFTEPLGQLILNRIQINLLVFDEQLARIVKWIP
jgi:hypothetical protein